MLLRLEMKWIFELPLRARGGYWGRCIPPLRHPRSGSLQQRFSDSVKLIAQETAWLALEAQPSRREGRARSMRRSLRRRHLTLASPRSRRSLVAVASRWRRIPLPSRIPACRLAAGELLLFPGDAVDSQLEPSSSCRCRACFARSSGRCSAAPARVAPRRLQLPICQSLLLPGASAVRVSLPLRRCRRVMHRALVARPLCFVACRACRGSLDPLHACR